MRTVQELGSTSDFLGDSSNNQPFDTMGALRGAVNDALRDVAVHVGIMGYDTITIVANTFFYTLNDSLMEGGLRHLSSQAFRVSARDQGLQSLVGLLEKTPDQFGALVTNPKFGAQAFHIKGNQFWIDAASPHGAKIYVFMPVRARMLMHGGAVPNVPNEDRSAVVYRAAELLGDILGDPAAAGMAAKFDAHVAKRGNRFDPGVGIAAP